MCRRAGLAPSSLVVSIDGFESMRSKTRADANCDLEYSGAKDMACPMENAPKTIAPKTLRKKPIKRVFLFGNKYLHENGLVIGVFVRHLPAAVTKGARVGEEHNRLGESEGDGLNVSLTQRRLVGQLETIVITLPELLLASQLSDGANVVDRFDGDLSRLFEHRLVRLAVTGERAHLKETGDDEKGHGGESDERHRPVEVERHG